MRFLRLAYIRRVCLLGTSHLVFVILLLRVQSVRGNRPGKQVQLLEHEIRYLCTKARDIFINQPILLELEAPIKICGTHAL